MTTFIDTNVLVYLLDAASAYHSWSLEELEKCRGRGPALISDIVYCELSVAMPSREDTDAVVSKLALERVRGSRNALYRAGQAFKKYRRNDGPKLGVLPDFIIGAIASDMGAPLITVNAKEFITYFPEITTISPKPGK